MTLHNRRPYLDFLRILACFLVIFNHMCGYSAYQRSTNPFQSFLYMGFTMFTRINVPIFFMISGALLLSKDISYRDLFFKKISRIASALICASLVIYLFSVRTDFSRFDLIDFLRKLLLGKHAGAYWYLYAYLGFLITLPFMRKIAKQFSHADFILFIAVHFLFSTFLPLFNYILEYNGIPSVFVTSHLAVPLMTTKAFFYPLMGYYIDRVFDITKINKRNVWILPGILFMSIVVPSAVTYHQGIRTGYTQQFVQTFDYTAAIATFLLVKYLFVSVKPFSECAGFHRILYLLGSLTFGIYLIDPILKKLENHFATVVAIQEPILYSLIWCLFSMTICGAITSLFKKIPLIKQLL